MSKILSARVHYISLSFAANAQISYEPTYNRNSGSSQTAQQVIRTTAYYAAGYDTYKLPIKVSVYSDGYTERYVVTSYYAGHDTSIRYIPSGSDPNWPSCNASVSKTNPYSSNEFERSFMFKAYVNGRYVYFDL